MDELSFTLSSPITEEQWDMISDVDLDNTNEITFHTKHGKEVKFVKAQPERKKGKWLRHPAYRQKDFCEWDVCSACGTGCHRREYGKNPDGTMYEVIYDYRFCPYCGAEIEGAL